mmetsp:Transcript_5499/g.12146  ORF Transcript_5499/g.12146 Transcript_5499/m.12146 type:complete len:211 (-) Transcript_5499:495-1127(-)
MISTQCFIDGALDVKAAAVDASPGLTIGMPGSNAFCLSLADLPGVVSYTFPFLTSNSFNAVCRSLVYLDSVVLTADAWAIKPVSPFLARASISSSSHIFCRACSSTCFSWRNFFLCFCSSLVLFCRAFCLSFSDCSASFVGLASAFPLSLSGADVSAVCAPSSVLTLPYPPSNARPTSACFKAPTSFPPSPHMKTCLPRFCSSRMIFAFP